MNFRRPSGEPAKDCLAHIMPEKLKHKQKLEKLVTELESINKMLKEAHEKKQKKLLKTKQKVDQTTEKWTQASTYVYYMSDVRQDSCPFAIFIM